MGTTADKLDAVLKSKNAIRDKFKLPDDLPFSKYAENIKGEAAFYKCHSVEKERTILYTVRGAGYALANGGYWDSGETYSDGGNATPILTNGTCFMRYGDMGMMWSIFDSYSNGSWGNELYCLEGADTADTLGWFEISGDSPSPCVSEGTSISPFTDIVVGGEGRDTYYGRWRVATGEHTGTDRTWVHMESSLYHMSYDTSTATWGIYTSIGGSGNAIYRSPANAENPWDGEWTAVSGSGSVPTVQYWGADDEPDQPENEKPKTVWSGYKAVLVEEEITTEGETVVVVSGATSMPAANGTYRPSNTETGQSAIYTSEDGQFRLFMEEVMYGHWCIMKGENNYDGVYYSQRSGTNPWDSNTTDWTYESSDIMNEYPTGKPESLTVTQETLEGSTEIKKYYDFEETLTEGLTYGYGFVPEVGKIYDAEAMIRVAALKENEKAIFVERFDGAFQNEFSVLGEAPVFTEIDGRSCLQIDTSHTFSYPSDGLPAGTAPRTIAAWIYTSNDNNYSYFAGYGKTESYSNFSLGSNISLYYLNVEAAPGGVKSEISKNVWTHVVLSFDGSTIKLYINGVLKASGGYTVNTVLANYPLAIGYCPFNTSSNYTNGYISNLKIYDYALTDAEIQELANS